MEHTEFVDDSSLKPFPTTKPYHKRCTQLKLQSGGKITYIEPNQLALPEHYTDVSKFPDKFAVEGFIVCVDVATKFDDPIHREFFDNLLHSVVSTKKPVVVALTKFDRAKEASVTTVTEIISRFKKQLHMVEVSAIKGINVDTCFLVLAHLIDSKKPKTKVISYSEAKALLDERIRRNEEALQRVLDERLTDFSISEERAYEMLGSFVEYQVLIDLSGSERVHKLVRAKLSYLKQQLIREKHTHFVQLLPHIFTAMIPSLPLDTTLESAKAALASSPKFDAYFMKVENWKEDKNFLKSSNEDQVPFELLEEEPEPLEKHIDEVRVQS